MNNQNAEDGWALALSGTPTNGTLCSTLSGTDYIWTGLHYLEFAAAGQVLILLLLAAVWYRCRRGKRSYVVNAMIAVQKYRFLIRQLVSRDFKTKYKRSVLGIFWSFLNPLLTMLVQYVVFSTIFKDVRYANFLSGNYFAGQLQNRIASKSAVSFPEERKNVRFGRASRRNQRSISNV